MSLARLYLWAQFAAFAGFAVAGYAVPSRFAAALGMSLSDVTAVADFSATYGGMSAGIAVVLALGATRDAWERPATLLAVTASAGLLLGRLVTLAQHGPAGAYIHGSMAVELLAALLGIVLLRGAPREAPTLQAA